MLPDCLISCSFYDFEVSILAPRYDFNGHIRTEVEVTLGTSLASCHSLHRSSDSSPRIVEWETIMFHIQTIPFVSKSYPIHIFLAYSIRFNVEYSSLFIQFNHLKHSGNYMYHLL
jgi:hypothetical protein